MREWIVNSSACPFLPSVSGPVRAVEMRRFGNERGSTFFLGALECAQSLWQEGLPAQAMLQLNRAFSADLNGSERVLDDWELPYRAMRWVMSKATSEQFIGNPRRHFQHLATRMVEPRRELRSARAWACWWHACELFPDFPADQNQISEEGIVEPDKEQIFESLKKSGIEGEADLWLRTITHPAPNMTKDCH